MIVLKLGASNSWNPQGVSRPVMGLLYLPYINSFPSELIIVSINKKNTSLLTTLIHVLSKKIYNLKD